MSIHMVIIKDCQLISSLLIADETAWEQGEQETIAVVTAKKYKQLK